MTLAAFDLAEGPVTGLQRETALDALETTRHAFGNASLRRALQAQ